MIDAGGASIDGHLIEKHWTSVHVGQRFVQRTPNSGEPSAQLTGVQVLYDQDAIYIGMRMYDTAPDSVRSRLSRRDVRADGSDWAHLYIDSFHDRRSAYRFSVNPRGVKLDALHFADVQEDPGWDAVWAVGIDVDSLGWSAEFRIPLSQLRFDDDPRTGQGLEWGINFGRDVARYGEQSFWSAVDADASGFVSEFGTVNGLMDLSSPSRLEITPYTLASLTRAPGNAENPFFENNEVGRTVGVDLRYGVTSDMTLSVTVNPDFGQVEADPSVVNLSAFETFLPEKRQFFLEGTDMFRVAYPEWPPLFYSRRVGRAPRGSVPDAAQFSDMPSATTILGAVKLTGKVADGLSVGIMNAVTTRESAPFVGEDGSRSSTSVEPPASYSVFRVSKDFREGESAVGFIGTATNRQIPKDDPNGLHGAAYAGGIDGRHRFGAGNYEIKGSVLASQVRGSSEAIARTQRAPGRYFHRPDARHLEFDSTLTSLSGMQTGVNLARIGGGHWTWSLAGRWISPGFEVNDLGFQNGGDQVTGSGSISYRENHPSGPFRRWDVTLYQNVGWSTGWEQQYGWTQFYGSAQFSNQWSAHLGLDRTYPYWSTEMLRGGPAIRKPGYLASWLGVSSDPRSAVLVGASAFGRIDDDDTGSMLNLQPHVTVRQSSNATLSLQPSIMTRTDDAQYVQTVATTSDRVFVVGRLRQTTASLTARVDYTFSPTLSLQFYIQPFISRATYDDFRQVRDPRAESDQQRFVTLNPSVQGPRPDFNFKQLRSNLVVRWEYLPGSTVFVVWGQDRTDVEDVGAFRPWRDARRLFGADGTHVFLVKVSYWFSR
jgi:hypothetical protein